MTQKWSDEPHLPFTGNLTNHLRNKHPEKCSIPAGSDDENDGNTLATGNRDNGFGPGSSKLLEDFARHGFLNPAREATQDGFYRLFAAWLLNDDLPWTTGETPSIHRLFRYLKVRFSLPSDTTVRNYVARLFVEMHENVVKELTVGETYLLS
jgi:hypothetical protein